MATPTDKLNPPPAPSRVFYSLGRMLAAEDFQADQDYHRGALARALLQLYGTGTVAGLYVQMPQVWQPNTPYRKWTFVFDSSQNVQVNTGGIGISGASLSFNETVGGTEKDGTTIVWTNYGPLASAGVNTSWKPSTAYSAPVAIVDSNSNVQVFTPPSTGSFVSGSVRPAWRTGIGATTSDGTPSQPVWTCVGPSQIEVEVTAGSAIDRVGRMIDSPSTVCIFLEPWLAGQAAADLNNAVDTDGNLIVDVFATFIPCTQGVTPCYASQDNYDATDAFSVNRLLDSFSMQLVLRSDANPLLPQDPWKGAGAVPSGAISPADLQGVRDAILQNNTGPSGAAPFFTNGAIPSEYPPGFDTSSVFLARLSIPATKVVGSAPTFDLTKISIDNNSRLFLYPAALLARTVGLTSGSES
jgi:hypothetical protein